MSGHSKWSTIKRQKETNDRRRAQIFTKLIRAVSVAAREGGPDPSSNHRLRLAVERAKAFNVPKERIERALARTNESAAESFSAEAIGPSGAALLIDGATDNRNRTMSEIRHLIMKNGGKMTPEGGARWAFRRRGIVSIDTEASKKDGETLSLQLISAGAEDIIQNDGIVEALVSPDNIESFRQTLTTQGVLIADVALGWVPQQTVSLEKNARQAMKMLVEALNEHPDVQDVWTNEA